MKETALIQKAILLVHVMRDTDFRVMDSHVVVCRSALDDSYSLIIVY